MLAAFSPSSFKWDTWSSIRLISQCVRSNTGGSAWYRRDFPKLLGRLINTSFPSSTISLFPVSFCTFKLEIRNVLLRTFNVSSRVAPYFNMKHAIWLVRLLKCAQFLAYVTRTVIGWNGLMECCLNASSRLWGGSLRDDTKNGCDGDYVLPCAVIYLWRIR